MVEGHAPVTVSVPPRLRRRIFLYYGRILDRNGHPTTSFTHAAGYSETRFEPCPGRPRTPWPGSLRVKGTAPVRLTVRVQRRTNHSSCDSAALTPTRRRAAQPRMTSALWRGVSVIARRKTRSGFGSAGRIWWRLTSSLSTTAISNWAKAAPRQRRTPPPKGIQV